MLMKIWTTTLLFLAWLSFCAWLVLVCHEKNIHPLRDFCAFFKKQSKVGRVLLGTFFIALWVIASTKPGGGNGGGDGGGGDGGTNNVPQMVPGPGVGNLQPMNLPGGEIQGLQGQAQFNPDLHPVNQPLGGGATLNLSGFEPITSTNTTHTIEAADFERGFVMTRIGTDEEFDFTPPPNATIVNDWRAFGAATDWIYAAFTNWTFKVATNDVSRLRIHSYGKVEPLIREVNGAIATNNWFAPFIASLGIVPQANWNLLVETDRPSQVWYVITPEGSLLITWQNALLDRDTGKPISFQIEFKTDGQFIYRYDFSRLDVDSVTNILAGASFAGNIWATNSLPTNVTSMAFYPLTEADAYDQDPDNDGLLTIDELFFYNTDPHNADTDYDGLNDGEELFVYNSDPLDPNSISAAYCDGFAVKLGDLDPFSCPEGSTNTIYEHIFYTGTTNAPFAYPVDTNDTAVLTITVSGSGTGRIVIGDIVVPVMARPAPPPLRGSGGDTPDPTANSVRVSLPRGVEFGIWGSIPETLQAEIDAGSYTIGHLPAWYTLEHGWIAFPNTEATAPCIHDLNAKKLLVYLDPGRDIRGLVCTWNPTASISVEAKSDLSAELTGSFPRSSTTPVTYTLTHPRHLYGPTVYTQTARFCPRLSEDDDDDLQGDGMPTDEEYGDEHGCSCSYGACCGNPWCDCGCACCEVGVGETPANICDEHNCPYDQCEDLHHDAYTNAMAIASMVDVLKLDRDPVYTNTIPIDVPDGWVKCCDCPDHWTNYVALAAKSYNLAVRTASGERFERTVDDCSIYVHGLAPSKDFKDSILSLCKTGVVYETHNYTVLGLKIDHPYFNLKKLNDANPAFGFPVVIGTNRIYGADFRLRTDVDLPSGNIHIGLDGNTPGFKLYLGSPLYGLSLGGTVTDDPLLLADSSTGKSFDVSLAQWKKIMAQHTSGREITVTLTAAQEGAADIVFGFAAVNGNESVNDVVRQRVTAIKPPLKADFNHNGRIDAEDVELFRLGNPFRFWINEEKVKLDRIPSPLPVVGGIAEWLSPEPLNTADLVVNGTYDLLNLFAVAIDLHDLTNKWGNCTVSYRIGGDSWGSSLNVTFADIPWQELELAQTNDVQTVYGGQLRSAPLTPLVDGDVVLDNVIQSFGSDSGVMLAESTGWDSDAVALKVYLDGAEAFRCRLPIRTRPVRWMYRWINSRHLSGEGETRPTNISLPDNAPYGVDSMKKLVFLHGANVSEFEAEFWGDQLFKRLWHAGCNVDFYNVDWRSDMGTDVNYQQNVSNAFDVASKLAVAIGTITGDKIVMAHSLGNMVVSSMIQDYGLTNNIQYIACNSAVPSEAYVEDGDLSMRTTSLVNSDWEEYPTNSWTASWYTLFKDDPADDRGRLGWPARFISVTNHILAVFYSTGDEVLEIKDDNNVHLWTGVSGSLGHYSWHKQELFKGLGGIGGTDWSGWGFISGHATPDETNRLTDAAIKFSPIFNPRPESITNNVIPLLTRDAHRAQGIPALAPSVGWTGLALYLNASDTFDEDDQSETAAIQRPNGWPIHSDYATRWLHSDMKDVSYFYNFMFYYKLKTKGNIQ